MQADHAQPHGLTMQPLVWLGSGSVQVWADFAEPQTWTQGSGLVQVRTRFEPSTVGTWAGCSAELWDGFTEGYYIIAMYYNAYVPLYTCTKAGCKQICLDVIF